MIPSAEAAEEIGCSSATGQASGAIAARSRVNQFTFTTGEPASIVTTAMNQASPGRSRSSAMRTAPTIRLAKGSSVAMSFGTPTNRATRRWGAAINLLTPISARSPALRERCHRRATSRGNSMKS